MGWTHRKPLGSLGLFELSKSSIARNAAPHPSRIGGLPQAYVKVRKPQLWVTEPIRKRDTKAQDPGKRFVGEAQTFPSLRTVPCWESQTVLSPLARFQSRALAGEDRCLFRGRRSGKVMVYRLIP